MRFDHSGRKGGATRESPFCAVARGMHAINNQVMGVMRISVVIAMFAVAFAGTACKDAHSNYLEPSGLKKKKPVVEAPRDPNAKIEPIETTYEKMVAARAEDEAAAKALVRGDEEKEEEEEKGKGYVPAEYKTGSSRWKDVGVYVDGIPRGFLNWGEMPITLKPYWREERASADMMPGDKNRGERITRQRFYRFNDYLRAIGVEPRTIKEIHVYGPKLGDSTIATGKDLVSPAGANFMFRFGSYTSGKPVALVPEGFGNGMSADKIAGVMIYIKKKAPEYVNNQGFILDGEKQLGVPYYGEPIRGGIRVYMDDKLVTIIKRQELDPKRATKSATGEDQWNLLEQLKSQGADLEKAVEMWVIRDERRFEKFAMKDVGSLVFSASSQQKGGILLGDAQLRANVIAFHSRALKDSEIPRPTPEEEQ
jgi:hypothetical protein